MFSNLHSADVAAHSDGVGNKCLNTMALHDPRVKTVHDYSF